jgi:hypothetical protein
MASGRVVNHARPLGEWASENWANGQCFCVAARRLSPVSFLTTNL